MSNEIRGYSDEAVKRLSDDSFGVEKYVMGLCEFIKTCNTPMTISIQGDWGSGKTSMMNMIKEQISDSVHPVWFNTWQYSQFNMHDELAVSMLCALLEELKCNEDTKKEIVGNLGKLFKKATKVAVSVAAEAHGFKKIYDEISEFVEPNTTDFAKEIKNLKQQFQNVVDRIVDVKKNRVVVFVDDLDRLQPSKAVELLEVLKVFLDCDKCIYVLAVDYGVVTQGIKQKFGDLVGEEKGRSFFDKIIQLPFKMPVAQYDIENYVNDAFKNMNMQLRNEEVGDFAELIKLSIGYNPRSMKRLFNTYQLLNMISQANDMKSKKLLFGVVCMQMEFEKLYECLSKNPDVIRDFVEIGITDDIKEDISVKDEATLAKIADFMRKFNEVLQLDGKVNEVSECEVENLRKALSFSSITSVGTNSAAESDVEKRYKGINKGIVQNINKRLEEQFKYNFNNKQYRKNVDRRKTSDGVGYVEFKDLEFPYTFRYVIRTNYYNLETVLDIAIYTTGVSKDKEKFKMFFDKSPIGSVAGDFDDEPAWWYDNLLKYSSDCQNPEEQIENVVAKAFGEFRKFVEDKRVNCN